MQLIGRLAPGVGLRAAEAELKSVDAAIRREFPWEGATNGEDCGGSGGGSVEAGIAGRGGCDRDLLLSVTGIVLLIACVNVARWS